MGSGPALGATLLSALPPGRDPVNTTAPLGADLLARGGGAVEIGAEQSGWAWTSLEPEKNWLWGQTNWHAVFYPCGTLGKCLHLVGSQFPLYKIKMSPPARRLALDKCLSSLFILSVQPPRCLQRQPCLLRGRCLQAPSLQGTRTGLP